MRRFIVITALLAQSILMSGCATAWQSALYSDDLYSVHNKTEIANRQKAEAELAKAQYEAQQARYEAALAKIKAEAAKQGVTVDGESSFNGYEAILADSYESAYARRLYGFTSPTYNMPSSYYTLRYSDAFHYASAYDPAFYNIMVSGDMVWVEPKYITSMFGSWGAVAVPSYGWYYGWNDPFYYWNRPYYYGWSLSWSWNWGWNYPYYWGWGYPHYHYRPPHHYYPPHHGGVGNTGVHHNRPGMVVGRNPGASRPADRGENVRPSQPSSGRGSQPVYRGGYSDRGSYSNGSTSYRSGGGAPTSRGGYRGGSSYSGGGGSHAPYSSGGGGNVRGR